MIRQHRVIAVLEKFILFVEEASTDDVDYIAEHLNSMFDEMASDDFFGTEGQLDPRGDCRTIDAKHWNSV